ncbi:hypothetical protein Tco_0880456 [Tanacetum coccineum]
MVFLVASHKEEGSSFIPTPPIPVFDLLEEIVETIGDMTFEKRAKICYKTFLTILLKNHGLCIKGLSFTIGITFNAEKLLSYVVKSQFKDVPPTLNIYLLCYNGCPTSPMDQMVNNHWKRNLRTGNVSKARVFPTTSLVQKVDFVTHAGN